MTNSACAGANGRAVVECALGLIWVGSKYIDDAGDKFPRCFLLQAGIDVETVNEPHGGPHAWSHARYVLRSPIQVVAAEYEGGAH